MESLYVVFMRHLIRKISRVAIVVLACVVNVAGANGVRDAEEGTRALSTQDLDNAVELLTRGIQSEHLSDETLAVAYHNRGIAHQQRGDIARAVLDYTNAMQRGNLDPELRPRTLNNRAICFELLGDYEAALRDLNRAIALNTGYADAYVNRASVLRKLTAYSDAVRDYARASALGYPRQLKIANGLAQTYDAAGDRAQASRYYRAALAIDPNFSPARARLAALASPSPIRVADASGSKGRRYAAVTADAQPAIAPEAMGENTLRAAIVDQPSPITGSGFAQENSAHRSAARAAGPVVMPTGRGPKGGPEASELVPVLSADPVTRIPAPATATPAIHGAQLGSYGSEMMARQGWADISTRFRTELANASGRVVPGQHPRMGIVYRLNVAGLASRADADALCARLKRKGQPCIPVVMTPG